MSESADNPYSPPTETGAAVAADGRSISYVNTKEDSVAFCEFASRGSVIAKFNQTVYLGGPPAWLLLVTTSESDDGRLLPAALLLGGIWLLLMGRLYPRFRRVILRLSMVKHSGFWCEHALSIEDGYLVERTHLGDSRIKLWAIHRVEKYGPRFFIFVSEQTAHVLPCQQLGDAAEIFIEHLQNEIRAHS